MEFDQELSIRHLLKAYGESIEKGYMDLAQVILTRLRDKASPIGTTMERLSHYLSVQRSDPQAQRLKEECMKNHSMAFRALYEITPYGRFAHFVANYAIYESIPRDIEEVRIVDFDIGDGIQWPPLICALGPRRSVRFTCINDAEKDYKFERVRERLASFAQSMGLNLIVDNLRLDELMRIGASEGVWLVFNCMVGLPHMNMGRRSQVEKFIEGARNSLVSSSTTNGMLICGNGRCGHELFSNEHLLHSQALLESMEWHFPSSFSLARTSMECLFIGPCVSSCLGEHELVSVGSSLEGCRFSKQNLMEAMEIVRGGDYGVKVRGEWGNEMVLEWRGTPLVRVCAWR
ncbi:nodulation-signaling pathway 2 protein-like [Asparagus officinalis]|nr:nodulation-signaling pathway 2 protein-like [Asparagus officinalis]